MSAMKYSLTSLATATHRVVAPSATTTPERHEHSHPLLLSSRHFYQMDAILEPSRSSNAPKDNKFNSAERKGDFQHGSLT